MTLPYKGPNRYFRKGQRPSPTERIITVYLSIGNDFEVRTASIVGIFDLDNTSTSARTRAFLTQAEKMGQVVPCDGLPKSFIVTVEYGMERVYLTPHAAVTLQKRMK